MPLARMAMYAQGVELYVAPTADTRDTWQATIRHIACEGRCFVLSCCQYSTKDLYPADFEVREELAAAPEVLARGGSAIIGPLGQYLAGPLFGEEGILYAELDFADLAGGKFDFDVVGHYARADVLRLVVNTKAHLPVEMQPTLPTTALEPEINQAGVPLEAVDESVQP
jgi:nitrilase